MIYPTETIKSWSKKYEINPIEDECPKCGIKRVANIPFADGVLRGFISEVHECGERYTLVTFVDTTNQLVDLFRNG